MKNFEDDFYKLLHLLKIGEPFAFNRFSDGELYMLQNKEVILGDHMVKIGDRVEKAPYHEEDFKRFHPEEHSFYRDRLVEAFKFTKRNYFKGLSCRCCVGEDNFQWQLEFHGHSDENFTWANLLVNGNYQKFIREMYPLFNDYRTVFICNKKNDLTVMPFVVKDFRVGYNAMVNDYGLIEEIKSWIDTHGIERHLFLFSASAFSKMAIHQLYAHCDRNTYIDVGHDAESLYGNETGQDLFKILLAGRKGERIFTKFASGNSGQGDLNYVQEIIQPIKAGRYR